jgi:hypothetical protein
MTNSIQRAPLRPIAGQCGLGDAGASGAFSPYLPLACRPNLGFEWQAAFSRKMISRGLSISYWEAFDASNSGKS